MTSADGTGAPVTRSLTRPRTTCASAGRAHKSARVIAMISRLSYTPTSLLIDMPSSRRNLRPAVHPTHMPIRISLSGYVQQFGMVRNNRTCSRSPNVDAWVQCYRDQNTSTPQLEPVVLKRLGTWDAPMYASIPSMPPTLRRLSIFVSNPLPTYTPSRK